ncbi:rod shape-determining protein MreD [Streptomyces sp. A7024]|uniref:Rod shape-determining protein MreD n=1 Tax=Streptomyces coryli TaxID=1128680 RepID=A0A6G4UDE5_9ACTN|nr:rod shape-determining protein MreD [Streptomyces coryli]NGN69367.1 rod shape-determining protein MreD [Streptomyces coryli]
MHVNRLLLAASLVVVALVIQVSVLARLHLPGAVPDLMLLVVLGLALVYGHTGGALVGFGAGLLADLAPPADHAVGRYALVLAVIGYFAGLVKPEKGQVRSAAGPMVVVAVAAICSTLLYAGVGALVSDSSARGVGLGGLIFSSTLYDLLLAPFVVPAIMALARKAEREVVADGTEGTAGSAAGDSAYRWLAAGTASGRGGRRGRGLIGRQKGGVFTGKAPSKVKVSKIKGVKRL